jgi:hypothetical protein
VRSGQIKRRKEIGDFIEVRELAPAVLHELKSPIKPDGQKERALQPVEERLSAEIDEKELVEHRGSFALVIEFEFPFRR